MKQTIQFLGGRLECNFKQELRIHQNEENDRNTSMKQVRDINPINTGFFWAP